MVTVKNANVVLEIADDEVEKYFEKGFSVIDKFGNVVRQSVPTELGALQKAYQDLQKENALLKEQLERAKTDVQLLSMAIPKAEAPKATVSEEPKKTTSNNNNKKKAQQ